MDAQIALFTYANCGHGTGAWVEPQISARDGLVDPDRIRLGGDDCFVISKKAKHVKIQVTGGERSTVSKVSGRGMKGRGSGRQFMS